MPRLMLPLSMFKIQRILLPFAVFVAGIIVFICGLVRSYHLPNKYVHTTSERLFFDAQNDHVEWWVGFLLMLTAVLAIVAVIMDQVWLFKLSVLMTGFCFAVSIFAIYWDAGEFSVIARDKHVVQFLERDGHICETKRHSYSYAGANYTFHDCECTKGDTINIGFFIGYSCELLSALYYVHAVLAFSMACSIAFSMFTIFSFVLILKRISQITTALHLDEKPLSEDFANVSGDLYIES